jgi:molybdenum-dependent DNA-binding transcriptional regulator ModE
MSKSRSKLTAEIVRERIIQLLSSGLSISKASKIAGISYKHAKQIAEQEGS